MNPPCSQRSTASPLLNSVTQYRLHLLHRTIRPGELAALYRLSDETPLALGNGGAKKLAVPLLSFGLSRAQREIARIMIKSLAVGMAQPIPAT